VVSYEDFYQEPDPETASVAPSRHLDYDDYYALYYYDNKDIYETVPTEEGGVRPHNEEEKETLGDSTTQQNSFSSRSRDTKK